MQDVFVKGNGTKIMTDVLTKCSTLSCLDIVLCPHQTFGLNQSFQVEQLQCCGALLHCILARTLDETSPAGDPAYFGQHAFLPTMRIFQAASVTVAKEAASICNIVGTSKGLEDAAVPQDLLAFVTVVGKSYTHSFPQERLHQSICHVVLAGQHCQVGWTTSCLHCHPLTFDDSHSNYEVLL